MLVIPRSKGESLVINDRIRITVVDIRGDEVVLSIDGPDGMTIQTAAAPRARQRELAPV